MTTTLLNQAVQAHQRGRISEAESLYRQIISQDPKNFDALHMLGIVCSNTGKIQEADKLFRVALSIDSGFPPCHVNYGFCLLKQKRLTEAVEHFDKALALFPNFADAWLGRGNALRELKRYDEALAAYNKATGLKPNLAEAHAGCGKALSELKRYDEANTAYDRALSCNPDLEFAAGERLHGKMRACDWRNFAPERERLLASVKDKKPVAQPFAFLSISSSPEEQLACAKSWVSRNCPASTTPIWRGEVYRHDKIRVAYVSADFRQHPVSYLIAGFLEGQSRDRFELTGISLQPEDPSEIGQRIKHAFDRFIDASAMPDEKAAHLIRELEIDIVVDLNGHTQHSRPTILAQRGAPVQATYLGFPGTTGAEYIDYLIADRTVIPAESIKGFSEKIAWLPDTFWVADRELPIGPTPSRTEAGLPEGNFVFCCFNQAYKIAPDTFDCWMRILKQAEGSILWLSQNGPIAAANLKSEAARRGVDPGRLIFAPLVPKLSDHLARLKCADLFLDTLPYNAHTTASDALWAGLPVATLVGQTFAGRVAASLLTAIGMTELITATQNAYEALAVELATNTEKLAATKDKLARNRLTTPLFDTQRFIGHIEAAYTAMYRRHQAGLAPDHIQVLQ